MSSPPSPTPDFSSARALESNTEWLMGVSSLFFALAIITLALRLYTRFMILKRAGLDDYFMLAAGLCSIGGIVLWAFAAQIGMGKHNEFISKENSRGLSQIAFFQSLIPNTGALAFLKISLALALLRLSRAKWYTWTLWVMFGFVVATSLLAWGTIIFYCQPVSGWWDKRDNPQCYSIKLFISFAVMHTAFNIFSDVAFATLPIPIIWMLQMKKRTKIYLVGIMSLGWIAVVMGVIKAVYQIGYGGDPDGHFMEGVQFWSYLQTNTGIIAACAPTLKPLVGRALKLSSYYSSNAYGVYGNGYGNGGGGGTGAYGNGTGHGRSKARANKHGYINQSSQIRDPPGAAEGDVELNDRPFHGQGAATGPVTTVYGLGGAGTRAGTRSPDSGSEEMILQGVEEGKGIIRTTEISVQR